VVFRFKNLFGKWGRPNYNSVTATFCHNIANDLPIQISDPAHAIDLTHIDDVIAAFIAELAPTRNGFRFAPPLPSRHISLGELADKIQRFRKMRINLALPDFKNPFDRALYGTYLTYLNTQEFGYGLEIKSDPRGSLAEFLKSPEMGQIFVSRTKPGITRGDHYHHTKTEKFLVLQGTAVIRFRHITKKEILEYHVRGEDYRVVDIPPGYTHHIENIGQDELVTLFWASEPFNPNQPDTYFESVLSAKTL
jgi:UDP-2-acetamido-2,6-beta-L-arabino-hexul-4-ose reductase